MNTPSHLIITAALRKRLQPAPIPTSAVLWGAIAPDIPLYILSIGGMLYFHFVLGKDLRDTMHLMYDDMFYNNPYWIIVHNFLHAPLILLFGMALSWWQRQRFAMARWLFWFLASCLLHTTIDIVCHANDGPLLLFPLNWNIRFNSPISYWDPRHYGVQFTIFELTLDVLLLGYLLVPRCMNWLRQRQKRDAAAS